MEITTDLVRHLIAVQFPEWRHLDIVPVKKSGHDNRTFHLGDEMSIRLPSHERYAAAIEKEWTWLPILAQQLSIAVPKPIAKGEPMDEYPLPWLINRWIEGDTVTHDNTDAKALATDLAMFLNQLTAIDASEGIPAGPQNFHRGGNLVVYNDDTTSIIDTLHAPFDQKVLCEIWELALASTYSSEPVWLHGDVAVGNLLVKEGQLCGVIDFGNLGVGDPACDLVMAWNFFDDESRAIFLNEMGVDDDMINRARGWALWKALISYAWHEQGSELSNWGEHVLHVIVKEYGSFLK